MPRRTTPLVTGEYYHIFNRGIDKRPIVKNLRDRKRIKLTMRYYFSETPPKSLSKFLKISSKVRKEMWLEILKAPRLISLISYCFMPNHFHFLLKQNKDEGISTFIKNFQNSYTRFFNIKYQRIGTLWQGQFKCVRISDDSQLLHMSRYIHLNPHTSFVVQYLEDISTYPWSSFLEYTSSQKEKVCDKKVILSQFKDKLAYKQFVLNHASYQKKLGKIKHLTFD